MGLFSSKTEKDKAYERVAKALEAMRMKHPDGKVHAGVFDVSAFADMGEISSTIDGVLGFLQENDREIIDVKLTDTGTAAIGVKVLVLYR